MYGWQLAADEHGILDVADLRRAGFDSHAVTDLVRAGELHPLARNWYVCVAPATPEERHCLTTRAMLRAHEDRTIAGHHSGLLLLGLPTYRPDLSTVRLSRRTGGGPRPPPGGGGGRGGGRGGPTRTRPGVRVGRVVPLEAQRDETVAPALAVVQHGISAGPLSALVAADAAVHRGLTTHTELAKAVAWVERHPNSALIAGFVALADGRRGSPGETRLAHLFHLMKVPVTPQYEIATAGFTAVVDFRVDGEMVVVEFDGRVKYGRSPNEPDPFGNRRTPQEVLWLEKRREDRLRELGYEVVRVIWSELDDPKAVAQRIAAAVHRARRRHGRPFTASPTFAGST
jgi:Transcriptional regulator, AbiEi antitoxin